MAGFAVRTRGGDRVTLGKSMRVVHLPNAPLLSPEELAAVLRDAGVRYLEFLDFLSETPTEPDVLLASALRRKTG